MLYEVITTMIRFDNVSKRYPGGYEALSNVSFDMQTGAMAFLTGHSGAGKSTLLKLVALIERVTRGQLFLDGQNVTRISSRRVITSYSIHYTKLYDGNRR